MSFIDVSGLLSLSCRWRSALQHLEQGGCRAGCGNTCQENTPEAATCPSYLGGREAPGGVAVSAHGSGAVSPSGASCHTQCSLRHLRLWGFATCHLRSFIPCGCNSAENYVQGQLIFILCSTNSQNPPHRVEEGLGTEEAGRPEDSPWPRTSDLILYKTH